MKHCKVFLILAALALSACSPLKNAVNPYHENFKCRAGEDTGECIDTPTAYRKARYPEPEPMPAAPGTQQATQPAEPANLTAQGQRYKVLAGLLREPRKPLLQPPKILRVLLLPYRGEEDELFMTRYVYLKIEDSRWILTDLSEKEK
ncbi:TraV family lipoprotein [Thermodesulfobacteriota bacterium B35]